MTLVKTSIIRQFEFKKFTSIIVLSFFVQILFSQSFTSSQIEQLTNALDNLSAQEGVWQDDIELAGSLLRDTDVDSKEIKKFFDNYFEERSLNTILQVELLRIAVLWGDESGRFNAQEGIFESLMGFINQYLNDPNVEDLFRDKDESERVLNFLRFLSRIYIEEGGDPDIERKVFDFCKSLVESHPQYFKKFNQIDDRRNHYLGIINEQIHLILRDFLIENGNLKDDFIDIVGLSHPSLEDQLEIFLEYDLYLIENLKASDKQLKAIVDFLNALPTGVLPPTIGTWMIRDFYTDNFKYVITTSSVSFLNFFSTPIGVGDNGFPTEISNPNSSASFSIVVAHEVCHSIDAYYIEGLNARLAEWKEKLRLEAGTEKREFLRSVVEDVEAGFFSRNGGEFFASLGNIYFNSTKQTLDLGLIRFKDNYLQPINQFLLAADVFSVGTNSTIFYEIDIDANVETFEKKIYRDEDQFINRIEIDDNTQFLFILDEDKFVKEVIEISIVHPTCSNSDDGSITLNALNNTSFNISWDNGVNDIKNDLLSAGGYNGSLEVPSLNFDSSLEFVLNQTGGTQEVPYNGIDDDCDPNTLDDDLDRDGFLLEDDCNDNDASINPDEEDIPDNGIDENCDNMDAVTSATYELGEATITIAPNPTFGIVNIKSESLGDFLVTIFNIQGQKIQEDRLKSINATIDLIEEPDGIYFLRITDSKLQKTITDKIIKHSR